MIDESRFKEWVDANEQMPFETKCTIKFVLAQYILCEGANNAIKNIPNSKAAKWEEWLDKDFTWSREDRMKGLDTSVYNALRRAHKYDYDTHTSTYLYKTNRDLEMVSDDVLAETRNLSKKNSVPMIREYLRLNKERIMGNEN